MRHPVLADARRYENAMSNTAPAMRLSVRRHAVGAIAAFMCSIMLQTGTASAASREPVVSAANTRSVRPLSILFVGNSHMLIPGFINRVVRRIKAKSKPGRSIRTRIIAKIGTTLRKTRKKRSTISALRAADWDIIVLQESTTAFMTTHGRRNFMSAIKWFRKHKPSGAELLLWQAWPQGASHALYHRRGVWGKWFKNPPRNPKQLFSWIAAGSKRAADANALHISPIGHCWMRLPAKKRPYSRDDYHASTKGLMFIAEVLARSIIAIADRGQGNTSRVKGTCP